MCVCACVCTCRCVLCALHAHAYTNTYDTTPIWKPRDNLRELVASSQWVGPRKASPLPDEPSHQSTFTLFWESCFSRQFSNSLIVQSLVKLRVEN